MGSGRAWRVLVAITINFVLFRALPGSAINDLSRVPHATQALRRSLAHEFGLDKSKPQQYVIYIEQLLRGNMGISFANQQPVSSNPSLAQNQAVAAVAVENTLKIVHDVVVIGCEPAILEDETGCIGLTGPVEAAVDPAIEMIRALVEGKGQ